MNRLCAGAERLLQVGRRRYGGNGKVCEKVYLDFAISRQSFQIILLNSWFLVCWNFEIWKKFSKTNNLKKGDFFLVYEKCFPYEAGKYLPERLAGIKNLCNFAVGKPHPRRQYPDFANGRRESLQP